MALYEDVWYNADGRMVSDSLMQYKIPTRLEAGRIHCLLYTSMSEGSGTAIDKSRQNHHNR